MSRRQHPLVAVEPDTLPELRRATREAHEAIQALRDATEAARAAIAEVDSAIASAERWSRTKRAEIDELLQGHARAAMRELGDELARGRDRTLEQIQQSMDDYWRIMLGVSREQLDAGEETVGELLHRRIIRPLDEVGGRVVDLERRVTLGPGS